MGEPQYLLARVNNKLVCIHAGMITDKYGLAVWDDVGTFIHAKTLEILTGRKSRVG
jgi:hypothetical protein